MLKQKKICKRTSTSLWRLFKDTYRNLGPLLFIVSLQGFIKFQFLCIKNLIKIIKDNIIPRFSAKIYLSFSVYHYFFSIILVRIFSNNIINFFSTLLFCSFPFILFIYFMSLNDLLIPSL